MTPIDITYHDGRRAQGQPGSALLNADGTLVLRLAGQRRVYLFRELRIAPRLASLPRVIRLPDGARLETSDHEVFDPWLRARGGEGWRGLIHRLEASRLWVLGLLLAMLLAVWGGVSLGLPLAARELAESLPAELEQSLGDQALAVLDRQWFEPSGLPAEQVARVQALVASLAPAASGHALRLQLRAGDAVGANAFALPGGTLIVTDALVELAASDEELLAVLAHEAGHVVHRHGLRMLLQNSVLVLALTLITGDPGGLANLGVALPVMLMQASYSRDFEREADDFAAAWLQARGIPPARLGEVLRRLAGEGTGDDGLAGYFSTHPSVAERMARLQRH